MEKDLSVVNAVVSCCLTYITHKLEYFILFNHFYGKYIQTTAVIKTKTFFLDHACFFLQLHRWKVAGSFPGGGYFCGIHMFCHACPGFLGVLQFYLTSQNQAVGFIGNSELSLSVKMSMNGYLCHLSQYVPVMDGHPDHDAPSSRTVTAGEMHQLPLL